MKSLGPLRHTCHGCAMCCFGHRVGFVDDAEEARIRRHGAALGVDDPVEDGAVRFVKGRCVFLAEDLLCDIHRTFGAEEKPLRCQEYPRRAIQTEEELRVGIDPTCSATWRSWRDGPEQPPASIVRERHLPEERPIEDALLKMAGHPQATPGLLLHMLGGLPPALELPEGFASRWIERLQQADIGAFIGHDEVGDGVRGPIADLAHYVAGLDPAAPPELAWTEEQQKLVLHTLRGMIFLRNGALRPATQGVALLTLGGGVLLGWRDTEAERFGSGLAAWCRAIEFRAFWLRLLPDPTTLRWLATGRR